MRTEFQKENASFSLDAHMIAQKDIYPKLFKAQRLRSDYMSFESTTLDMDDRGRILDGEMAIDRIVKVHGDYFQRPFHFSIQERFRRAQFAHRQDLTITEWNNASDTESELYKLYAGIFVYGYFDNREKSFLQWLAINTPSMMIALLENRLPFSRETNRKRQDFIAIPFQALRDFGCVLAEHSPCALTNKAA